MKPNGISVIIYGLGRMRYVFASTDRAKALESGLALLEPGCANDCRRSLAKVVEGTAPQFSTGDLWGREVVMADGAKHHTMTVFPAVVA